ncbi:glycosyltransferase family 4 protein [Corynebacterium casei]
MTSVYRARAVQEPQIQFDHIFCVDRGGSEAYEDLENTDMRLVGREILADYINFSAKHSKYSELRITSLPELPSKVSSVEIGRVIYEFHSPNASIIRRELAELDVNSVDEIWTPSDWCSELVESLKPQDNQVAIKTVPNQVDTRYFNRKGQRASLSRPEGAIPVSWIGRLENNQKNYLDFLLTIRKLPKQYYGLMLYSFENDPDRVQKFLGDAAAFGVLDRIELYSDVPQPAVSDIHRAVRDAGGVFYSTSLSESFGYAVLEAALCGCRVVSFDVGPLRQHPVTGVTFIDVGDIRGAVSAILEVSKSNTVVEK